MRRNSSFIWFVVICGLCIFPASYSMSSTGSVTDSSVWEHRSYKVKLLATGDMSFASHKIYDIDIWAAGEGKWLEVSSCTNFLDFQARRANIRYRSEADGGLRFIHTLNASGVALPRLLAAIWENNQTVRGTIMIPEKLRPYMNGQEEIKIRK